MNSFPLEIVKLICSFADIDSIEKLNINLDKNFWDDYFHSYKLKIVTERDSLKQWIKEFKIQQKLSLSKCIVKIRVSPISYFEEYPRPLVLGDFGGVLSCNMILFSSYNENYYKVGVKYGDDFYCYYIEKERAYQVLFTLFEEDNILE